MSATARKVGALCAKDFPDLFKNPVMIVSILFPVGLVLAFKYLYGSLAAAEGATDFLMTALLGIGVCMTAAMVPSMVVIYSIAEEKEKHTLRTLMLANVSGSQVLLAKTAVALVVASAANLAIFFILETPLAQLPLFLIITLVGMLPLTLFCLLLGMGARDQMSAGLFSMPVIIVALLPMFGGMNSDVSQISTFTPCGGMFDLVILLNNGRLFTQDAVVPLASIAVWVFLTVLIFRLFYKRFGRDN